MISLKNSFLNFIDTYVSMVTVSVNNLMVPVGTNTYQMICIVTLSSSIGPNISALSISWQHNNQPVDTSQDRVQVSEPFGALNFFSNSFTLSDISQHDSGEYCCTASIAGNQTKPEDCVEVKVTTNGKCISAY